MVLDDDRASLWHSPCCPIVLRGASDLRSRCIRAGARFAARVSLSLRLRCARGAAGVSPKRRPVFGQHAASTSIWDASPVRGATLRCLSGLGASVPPIMRTGTIATPLLHTTDGGQDKSRTVRPGRTAKERWPISAQPQCALSHCDVRFLEIPATSKVPAHCPKRSPDQSYDRAAPRVVRPFCSALVSWPMRPWLAWCAGDRGFPTQNR
jgi:hypothetical protein